MYLISHVLVEAVQHRAAAQLFIAHPPPGKAAAVRRSVFSARRQILPPYKRHLEGSLKT
jgi:hypothetical protein